MNELSTRPAAAGRDASRRGGLASVVHGATAALVLGALQVVLALSLAALVFTGELAPFVARGIGFVMVGTIVAAVAMAIGSTLPGTLGGSQSATGALLAVIGADVAAALGSAAAPEARLATAIVAMGATTLATGAFLLALGRFRLGDLVRFLPHPVIGGFVAGTGWLISVGAVTLMAGVAPGAGGPGALLAPEALRMWLPGLGFALLLTYVVARGRVVALPAALVGAVGLFYLAAWAAGVGPDGLAAAGWLLGPFPEGDLWRPLTVAELGQVDWAAIARQGPAMAAVLPIAAVAVLLNAGSLESAAERDVDLNRELRGSGLANLLTGSVGGLVAYPQLGTTDLALRLGARSRAVALGAAAIVALALFAGASFLSLVPRFALGGLLLYIGLGFLKTWLLDGWDRLPRREYAVLVAIVAVIATLGFVEGVAVGVVAAVVLFVVTYSRIDVVRHELTGAHARSRVTRPPEERAALERLGGAVLVLQLQGYVFFGTGHALVRRVRERLESPEPPRFLVLDVRRVTGLDSTAASSFRKMLRVARGRDVTLVLTHASPGLRAALEAGGLTPAGDLRYEADLDEGLEACEAVLLRTHGPDADAAPSLEARLAALVPDDPDLPRILPYLERRGLAPGERLVKQGDAPDRMYVLEHGTLTARLERPGEPPLRLQTVGPGNVLGELGFFLREPRSATVLADGEAVVHGLDREGLARMEREDPAAALALHRLVVRLLSERVGHLVGVVRALEE